MTHTPANPDTNPHIQVFALGDFQTNCMILTQGKPEKGKECWIIDCGYEPEPMLDAIESQGLVPIKIILTHAHADHIAGLTQARSQFPDTPILMHKAEEDWLNEPMLNLSAAIGLAITAPSAESFLDDGDTVSLGTLEFEVLHTPGHSPGGITLVCRASKVAFVGDTLFAGSVGRTDFPGSSMDTLAKSIRTKLYTLDPETLCYPGHGPKTTIGSEKSSNPFVRG